MGVLLANNMTQWNPAIAIKTATEMMALDRKEAAIKTLSECMSGRKNKNQWQPDLEVVITIYLDASLKLQDYKALKEGLHQYRTICYPSNTSSLEKVIQEFLGKADRSIQDAEQRADSVVKAALSDSEESVESKILRSVSGEELRERTRKNFLQPYFKFTWESYRAILDLVRNKPQMEVLYFNTAMQAIRFAEAHERKMELKRIGETLRSHFGQLLEHGESNANMISISSVASNPASLNAMYGIRFEYLNAAVSMELWQEAFRAAEDINAIMNVAPPPTPPRLAKYYERLAQLFWLSHNYVFHAYAWLKFHLVSAKHNRSLSKEDVQRNATIVLLAALSAPMEESSSHLARNHQDYFELQFEKEKNSRFSSLLGRDSHLRRDDLVRELLVHDIPSSVLPEYQQVYQLAEEKYHPLTLCQSLEQVFKSVQSVTVFARYTALFTKACFTRQLQQLSRAFQVMKLDRVYQLAPSSTPHQIEKLIVKCTNNGLVAARINHSQGTLSFLNSSVNDESVKDHLAIVADRLREAARRVQPMSDEKRAERRIEFFSQVPNRAAEEYNSNPTRFDIIEDEKEKKEIIERLEGRLADLRRQLNLAKSPQEAFQGEGASLAKDTRLTPEELEQDRERKEAEKAARQEKERRETLQKKFNKMVVRLDYLERARRQEEKPLLDQIFEESNKKERAVYQEKMENYLKQQKDAHTNDLKEKKRLEKVNEEASKLKEKTISERLSAFQVQLDAVKKHNEGIQAAINEEKERIRKEKVQEEKERRIAEEKHRAEEEARREKEEEERKKREAEEKANSWAGMADEADDEEPASRATGSAWANRSAQADRPRSGWANRDRPTESASGAGASRGAAWGRSAADGESSRPSTGGAWKPTSSRASGGDAAPSGSRWGARSDSRTDSRVDSRSDSRGDSRGERPSFSRGSGASEGGAGERTWGSSGQRGSYSRRESGAPQEGSSYSSGGSRYSNRDDDRNTRGSRYTTEWGANRGSDRGSDRTSDRSSDRAGDRPARTGAWGKRN